MSICPLCKRELGLINIDQHHLVPKTFKGKVTVPLHKICHRKIHATFTERELLNYYNTIERLLEHEQMQSFVSWVSKKPSEFYDGSINSNSKRSKSRR